MIFNNYTPIDLCALDVTEPAGHVGVRATQGETRSFVVIKQARGPACRVMTPRAIGRRTAPLELSGMDVFVTSHAAIGRRLERNLPYAGVLGFAVMAVDTGQHAMSSR